MLFYQGLLCQKWPSIAGSTLLFYRPWCSQGKWSERIKTRVFVLVQGRSLLNIFPPLANVRSAQCLSDTDYILRLTPVLRIFSKLTGPLTQNSSTFYINLFRQIPGNLHVIHYPVFILFCNHLVWHPAKHILQTLSKLIILIRAEFLFLKKQQQQKTQKTCSDNCQQRKKPNLLLLLLTNKGMDLFNFCFTTLDLAATRQRFVVCSCSIYSSTKSTSHPSPKREMENFWTPVTGMLSHL